MFTQSPQPPPEPPNGWIGQAHNHPLTARPTTAGLLPQNVNEEPSTNRTLSSPVFKNELMTKHLQMQQANSLGSIDERVKIRKELLSPNWQAATKFNDQPKSPTRMPDKLLSTSANQAADKRPFAYSPDVSDPNHRGKIDLSQIKSDTMRRRLLANMNSSEEDGDDAELDGVHQVTENLPSSSNHVGYYNDFAASQFASTRQPQSSCSTTAFCNEPTIVPHAQQQVRHVPIRKEEQSSELARVQYHQPPQFYTIKQGNYIIHKPYKPEELNNNNNNKRHNDKFDTLSAEVVESLQSLTLLADSLGSAASDSRPKLQADERQHQQPVSRDYCQRNSQQQYYNGHNMTTFRPSNDHNLGRATTSHESITSQRRQLPMRSSQQQSNRLIGDFLLSPDSNYFSPNTFCGNPYSLSPFESSSLEDGSFESTPAAFNVQSRYRSHQSTFSPSLNGRFS